MFQQTLLQFSAAVADGADFSALIRLFCRSAKDLFEVSGVYYWDLKENERLDAVDAEGRMVAEFLQASLQLDESAVANEAVTSRRTVYVNELDADRYPMAGRFGARAMLAAPLVVAGEVIGVGVLLHDSDPNFFTDDLAAKATILAAQLGTMAEIARLRESSLEERERAVHLVELTHALQSGLDAGKIMATLVHRVCALFGAASVILYSCEKDGLQTKAVAAGAVPEPLAIAHAETLAHAAAAKLIATTASELPAAIRFDAALHGGVVAFGDAVAVRIRTARREGVLLVCFPPDGKVSGRDFRLLGSLANIAGLILANAELYSTTEQHRNRAENLVKLGLELSSSLNLPEFVKKFTLRAAEMLDAHAAALVLAQGPSLETVLLHDEREVTDRALPRRLSQALVELGHAQRAPVSAGSAAELLGAGLAASLGWNDACIVRLAAASEEFLGYLCLAELRRPLSPADYELLRAISGHISVALENSRLFTRIAQSNKQWAEIFDAISDFIVVHDESNRVLRVNRSLAEFIGVRPPELIGVGMRALVSITAEANALPCPFCRSGMETADEYIHPVLERTYLVSTSRMRGALNEGTQTIHVLKDITDRREVERRYRELFDNTQEGIFFSSPEGRFIEVNDALVRMLGYSSRQELLEIDVPTRLYLQPEDRQRFRQLIEERGMVRNYQEVLRRKDGTLVHTLQNSFAVRDAGGKVTQYRGMILDITELKTFQSQLLHERDFNSKILNNTQSMILVSDTAGLISYANRRCFEAGGFKESELLGNRLLDLVEPSRRNNLTDALESVMSGQQVDNLELPIRRGSEKVGHFSMNLSPMRDEQGNVSSIVVVMTDITDAALLNAKLMHAEKMAAVGQLVSGVAHEVNNPLTAILGFADLLVQQEDIPESAKKDLAVIVQESQRTRQIVQNLLSFARQMPAERKAIDINAILRRTLQLRAYDLSSHGIDVVERCQPDLPAIVGDAHQLQQVFLNIINNAYDAVRETGRRGAIEISTSASNGMADIAFSDNGSGIAQPDRIFDPFFTTKEVGKGTGLGLSICYGIVHEHGGEITCQNNGERPGATFIVRLPLSAGKAAAGGQA
ncbi:MAG: PAS domain S-box protein [Candidatus Koribacter versatilis]|uniref:histidine kinase n=1 Tax=Candidatus Korobacter versatilis TaxID=658062 RepID=A0A932EPC3_9BACT|nr:PAS domain S-box protein [Candidatus Koribacter versatilis]